MPRLLAVDDDTKTLATIRRVAGLMGFIVDGVTQGREFELEFIKRQPNAVIIDMSLPDIGGIELIKWMGKVAAPTLIILMADLPDEDLRLLCSMGMPPNLHVRPLAKPFRNSELVAILRPLVP